MDKVYIVTSHDQWDFYDIAYFKTKKGALKDIMSRKYNQWLAYRYIGHDTNCWDYSISEKNLHE